MSGIGPFLIGLGAVMALNHLVVRTGFARRFPPLFYLVVGLDLVLAVGVLLVGLPGLPGLARLMVALVLMMHVAQDFRTRQQWLTEEREAELELEYQEARRLAEQEEQGQDPPG